MFPNISAHLVNFAHAGRVLPFRFTRPLQSIDFVGSRCPRPRPSRGTDHLSPRVHSEIAKIAWLCILPYSSHVRRKTLKAETQELPFVPSQCRNTFSKAPVTFMFPSSL